MKFVLFFSEKVFEATQSFLIHTRVFIFHCFFFSKCFKSLNIFFVCLHSMTSNVLCTLEHFYFVHSFSFSLSKVEKFKENEIYFARVASRVLSLTLNEDPLIYGKTVKRGTTEWFIAQQGIMTRLALRVKNKKDFESQAKVTKNVTFLPFVLSSVHTF